MMDTDSNTATPERKRSSIVPGSGTGTGAAKRWNRIKKVLKPVTAKDTISQQASVTMASDNAKITSEVNSDSEVTQPVFSESDNIQLMAFWEDLSMPSPPQYCPLQPPSASDELIAASYSDRATSRISETSRQGVSPTSVAMGHVFTAPPLPSYEADFMEESKPLSLMVNKVPKELIIKQKKLMDTEVQEEQQRNSHDFRLKEGDIIWREHLARQRVLQLEQATRTRLDAEKEKIMWDLDEKEKKVGRDFRRAREDLEMGVKRQVASIRENFGDMLTAGASLARKYAVQSTQAPQPVEVRIHFLRAVKTKLPKGKYVMMLTQYESLGGSPIGWSKVGTYGTCVQPYCALVEYMSA